MGRAGGRAAGRRVWEIENRWTCLFPLGLRPQKESKGMSTPGAPGLYHAWGSRGYRHVRTRYQEGKICFAIEQAPQTFRCANCGSSQVVKSGQAIRSFTRRRSSRYARSRAIR